MTYQEIKNIINDVKNEIDRMCWCDATDGLDILLKRLEEYSNEKPIKNDICKNENLEDGTSSFRRD